MNLDINYRIESDNMGSTLIFEEERCREVHGKSVPFVYTDRWYFRNVSEAMQKYVDLKLGKAEDVKEMLNMIKELRELIKKL